MLKEKEKPTDVYVYFFPADECSEIPLVHRAADGWMYG